MHGRAEMAEAASIYDDTHLRKLCCHGAQLRDRPVVRGIVDEDVLVLVLRQTVHDAARATMQLAYIELFVKAGCHDRDAFAIWH
jgi:hypothetical protein